ncbi:MAG: hypothetical protein V1770_05445 [bacterium]
MSYKKSIFFFAMFFIIFAFSGCGVKVNLENKLEESFKKSQDDAINVWENNIAQQQAHKTEEYIKKGISEEAKKKIDDWIVSGNYNQYGDPKNLMYTGGTPLFNEMTGELTDRYEYILRNHPELVGELKLE